MRFREKIIKEKIKEVNIIGGSHSGFSVAWMLLYGSAMFDYKSQNNKELAVEGGSPQKSPRGSPGVLQEPNIIQMSP